MEFLVPLSLQWSFLSFLAASPCQDGGVFRSGVWHLDVPTAHAREVPVSGNGRGRLCGRFGQISDSIRNLFISLYSIFFHLFSSSSSIPSSHFFHSFHHPIPTRSRRSSAVAVAALAWEKGSAEMFPWGYHQISPGICNIIYIYIILYVIYIYLYRERCGTTMNHVEKLWTV